MQYNKPLSPAILEKKIFALSFHYINIRKTSKHWGVANLTQTHDLINLAMLNTNYKVPFPSDFREDDFKIVLLYKSR